jgi:hypothetical protein
MARSRTEKREAKEAREEDRKAKQAKEAQEAREMQPDLRTCIGAYCLLAFQKTAASRQQEVDRQQQAKFKKYTVECICTNLCRHGFSAGLPARPGDALSLLRLSRRQQEGVEIGEEIKAGQVERPHMLGQERGEQTAQDKTNT